MAKGGCAVSQAASAEAASQMYHGRWDNGIVFDGILREFFKNPEAGSNKRWRRSGGCMHGCARVSRTIRWQSFETLMGNSDPTASLPRCMSFAPLRIHLLPPHP